MNARSSWYARILSKVGIGSYDAKRDARNDNSFEVACGEEEDGVHVV